MLDAVSELTEYRIGATRKEVLERVLPLARRQAIIVEADSKGADEKITDDLNKVFDHLVNRGNRYLPFVCNYFDGASGSFRERRIWLVKTVFTGQGRETFFSLIDEGYAADFGLHKTGALKSRRAAAMFLLNWVCSNRKNCKQRRPLLIKSTALLKNVDYLIQKRPHF